MAARAVLALGATLFAAMLVPAGLFAAGAPVTAAPDAGFEAAVAALDTPSFADKAAAAEALSRTGHPRAAAVLDALLAGDLHVERRGGKRMVIARRIEGGGHALRDALTGADLGEAGRRSVRRIKVNNRLRRLLRGLAAGRRLNDPDPAVRIEAAAALTAGGDPAVYELLRGRRAVETDAEVVEAIGAALMVFDLDSADAAVRLAAVRAARGNLDGRVRSKLRAVAGDEEADPALRAEARDTLRAIERTVARYRMIETVFFGLSLGSVLVLAAIGLSITFGVMGVINMAHGELIMLGAYTTYFVQSLLPGAVEYSLFIALPAAFLVSGLAGVAIERGVVRFLYGRPLETLLATFGVSLILQQAARTFVSPQNRAVATPEWMSGSWEIAQGLSFTWNRLYILLFAALVFAALVALLQRTRFGLEVRATMQNRPMARALGIRSARVDALTFGLGAGVAGLAGVALSQLTNVGPNLGQSYIVDSFLVVVFGGVGNLWGTLVAGLSLGVADKLLEPVAGAVVAKVLVLAFIILFLRMRPRGLFPQKGRAAEGQGRGDRC